MSLSNIDLTNPDNFRDGAPHHWFKELREKDPLHWHEERDGPGFWCVTRYEDLKYVSRNPRLFSSEIGGTQLRGPRRDPGSAPRGRPPIMLMMDPPQHVKFRRVVQRSFTPRVVRQQEPHIRQLAKRIVDLVAPRGECEFVEDVAAELPLQVICEMMGVPFEDRQEIFQLSNQMIGADDPELRPTDREQAQAASLRMFGHAMKVAQKFREQPADNLSSALLHGTIDGDKLSETEYAAFFLLLCVAGNETTRTVTCHGMNLLIDHPDQLDRLVREPTLIPSAVEEILRFAPAVHHFRRTATEDTELQSRTIRKGDKVVMWYPSVNRDEDVFETPEVFDVTRSPNDHLSFGIGEHFCLGANLARLELNVIFEEIIPRLREPKHTAPLRRLRSNFINGVKEMRIAFRPE